MMRNRKRVLAITNQLKHLASLKLAATLALIAICGQLPAQTTEALPAATTGNNLEVILLAVSFITIVLVSFVVFMVSDKLITISAVRVRGEAVLEDDDLTADITIVPSIKELLPLGGTYPAYVTGKVHNLKHGFDIKVAGRPERMVAGTLNSPTYSVKPTDFIGMQPIPKMLVEEKQEVKAGDPLFFDKNYPDVIYTAPVSGEITEIRRGEKRSIVEVVILADQEVSFKNFGMANPALLTREAVVKRMLESGAWTMLRQRPFDVLPNPADNPKGIFISGFDSAPLAVNYNFTLQGEALAFQAGIDALAKLTTGKVHLSLNAAQTPADTYVAAKNVEKHWFKGAHPAGTVGVQIHHIDPIAKGEVAWYINPHDVVILGRLFNEGHYNTAGLVAVAGPEITKPQYYKAYKGANVGALVKGNLKKEHVRLVSGSLLTGNAVNEKGHLGVNDRVVSVVEEGDFYEFLGWLLPTYARPSLSPTFPWGIYPGMEYDVNTNTHGEERAFVMTGQYEEVLPMDIYPQQLLKAIMARDFEKMEGLGIYEVGEEEFAICEFVCTSKQPIQAILRDGLDYMREQS
ncbi:Na(+)-translocating NADH-quinone reductase subunit A [soil metagenome]